MTDDKSKRDFRDRNKVSGDEGYEVEHFARENGITVEQTRELILKHGNNREILKIAAQEVHRKQRMSG